MKKFIALAVVATVLVSCGKRGGSSSSSTYGKYTSPYVTANGFVSALNSVDPYYYDLNTLEKDQYDSLRNNFFVYFDAKYNEYVAVDITYLRTLAYWDYYSNNQGLADEFRNVQEDDAWDLGLIGDGWGDDYEIVDYVGSDAFGDPVFQGFDTGYYYEDEEETMDTGLMAANDEELEMFNKASLYSQAFKLPADKALSLVTMEKEVKKMLENAQNGELKEADQEAIANNIKHFTGKSIEEFMAAKDDVNTREKVIDDVANHLGTTTQNIEDVILPELLSIEL